MFLVNGSDYSYLLDMYLGDGCVSYTGRSTQLIVTLDSAYPGLIVECADAIGRISPNSVSVKKHPVHNAVRVYSGWKLWSTSSRRQAPAANTPAPSCSRPGSGSSFAATASSSSVA